MKQTHRIAAIKRQQNLKDAGDKVRRTMYAAELALHEPSRFVFSLDELEERREQVPTTSCTPPAPGPR